MTDDQDPLRELGHQLPPIDLDAASADRIARTVRRQVGRGPSAARLIEPVVTAAFAISYLAWAIARVLEALR